MRPLLSWVRGLAAVATLLLTLTASAKPAPQVPSALQPPPQPAPQLAGTGATASAGSTPQIVSTADADPGVPPRIDVTRAATPLTPLSDATTDVGYVLRPRLSLQGDYAKASGLLAAADSDARIRTGLVVAFAPFDALDLFGAVLASANRNERKETARVDPELVTTSGDVVLGAKGRLVTRAGLGLSLTGATRRYAAQSSLGFGAASYWLAPAVTFDLRHAVHVPARISIDTGYVFDHAASSETAPADPQSRYVESYAHGVGYNRVQYGATLDVPVGANDGPAFLPYVHFHGEHVTASADPVLAKQGTTRDQSGLALGLRGQLGAQFALELAADVRLAALSPGYGAPQAPLTTFLAFTYVPAIAPPPAVIPSAPASRVGSPAAPPPTLSGRVTAASTHEPIAGAAVGVVGRAHARVQTDPDGTFVLRDVSPGAIELVVEAPHFLPARAAVEVPAAGDRAVSLALAPGPSNGQVRGHVLDEARRGVAAALSFSGPSAVEASSGADGAFSASLPPGKYSVRVTADGHLARIVVVDVGPNESTLIDIAVRSRPPFANVVLAAHGLDVKAGIAFDGATTHLTAASLWTLDEVADVLINHPEKRHVRIEASWDKTLADQAALDLTAAQAAVVRDYLVGAGVDDKRLEPVGLGATKAAAGGGRTMMQILRSGRAPNRHVEFVFVD
ncbi:MAG TPA: carboxypeptidase regulatory-like domain-containing protein [Polyangia bacterium]|jgi:outer membrane protein OmpA-like peptidoglycan-associated protein|nr:carboxypeptidase regulatory-like domain-containing protein [Polyangia bacterium]